MLQLDLDPTFKFEPKTHTYTLRGIRTLMEVAGFQVVESAKCPKTFSRIPLWSWVERALPVTFATDLAVRAVKPADALGAQAVPAREASA